MYKMKYKKKKKVERYNSCTGGTGHWPEHGYNDPSHLQCYSW